MDCSGLIWVEEVDVQCIARKPRASEGGECRLVNRVGIDFRPPILRPSI